MDLTINVSKWLHGEGSTYSELLRERDGKMCCLGFYLLACGLNSGNMLNIAEPNGVELDSPDEFPQQAKWLLGEFTGDIVGYSNDAATLMTTNDDKDLSDDERMGEISAVFADHGVKVTFVK